MSKIAIQKRIFDKNNFPKVVDTQFSQLINTTQGEDTLSFTLEDFFTLYEQLFFQIPTQNTSTKALTTNSKCVIMATC